MARKGVAAYDATGPLSAAGHGVPWPDRHVDFLAGFFFVVGPADKIQT